MKSGRRFAVALVTAPDASAARRLARAALKARLAACANLIPKIESHYWWRGKLETASEVLVLFKTTAKLLSRLEELVLSSHPYDTPEFLVLPIDRGTARYLEWLEGSVK